MGLRAPSVSRDAAVPGGLWGPRVSSLQDTVALCQAHTARDGAKGTAQHAQGALRQRAERRRVGDQQAEAQSWTLVIL